MTIAGVATNAPTARAGTRLPAGPVDASVDGSPARLLDNWLTIQSANLNRQVTSLRAFTTTEFGTGPAAPSEAHVIAVNRFVEGFRLKLVDSARWLDAAVREARRAPTAARLSVVLERKHSVVPRVLYVEGIWDFYFDLFVQRLSTFGERLLAVDRIAANCYEDLYLGLAVARPTPALLPFSYADSGFSPFTYRRGVPLSRLRNHRNLFPLIILPQHRLDAVWALSSVLHECAHNLQADVGLWDVLPGLLRRRLTGDGLPEDVADTWAGWHRELTADLVALLLGGPAAVESLMDVVGRSRRATVRYGAGAVHPVPYLRVLISLELLHRIGLSGPARSLRSVWRRLYPTITSAELPAPLLRTFDRACALVVDTVALSPHPQLAGRSLVQVLPFGPEQMAMIQTAGRRLAEGGEPGAVPLRFMISAARHALDSRLATPGAITDSFYRILGRR
jgi:hypothetical protein